MQQGKVVSTIMPAVPVSLLQQAGEQTPSVAFAAVPVQSAHSASASVTSRKRVERALALVDAGAAAELDAFLHVLVKEALRQGAERNRSLFVVALLSADAT